MPDRLVLWDVDHTLITTQGVGGEILAEVFEKLTGKPMRDKAEVTGKSELLILRETLALHDLPRDLIDFSTYIEALAEAHVRRAAELRERGHALPGAAAVLDALARVEGVRQTAATGNVRPVAEIKLQTFGLDRHIDFEIGGYGEDAEERADMIRTALRRAGSSPENAIIFDDTVAGVEAGRSAGVFTVAVASGKTSADELRNAGAQVVLPSLEDTTAVVDLVEKLSI